MDLKSLFELAGVDVTKGKAKLLIETTVQREPKAGMSYWLFNVDEEGYSEPCSFADFRELANAVKSGSLIGSNRLFGKYRVVNTEEITIVEVPAEWSQQQVEEWAATI